MSAPAKLQSVPCRTCGGTMRPARAARFNGCLQSIGVLVAIAGLVGCITSAVFGAVVVANAASEPEPAAQTARPAPDRPGETPMQKLARMEREAAAQADGAKIRQGAANAVRGVAGMGAGVSGFLSLLALLGGGSLLLRKSVWRCPACAAFQDRI